MTSGDGRGFTQEDANDEMKCLLKWILIIAIALGVVGAGGWFWVRYYCPTSNPGGYASVGAIPAPKGYHRIGKGDGFARYLRALPLKSRGAKVQLFTGGTARFQSLNYAVVDIPLLSNAEQCADMAIRLRAEYLYGIGQYGSIHFNDVNGNCLRYSGGADRKAFEKYLRKVYGTASTFSMSRELPRRPLGEIRPGDVFVYAGADRGQKLGHAVIVVDVAENEHGDRIFMIAEGNTPARDPHIVRNWLNPFRSPWFSADKNARIIQLSPFTYYAKDLRHW